VMRPRGRHAGAWHRQMKRSRSSKPPWRVET
jgi:hypothetical protein